MTQRPALQVVVTETRDPTRRARLDDLIRRTLAGELTRQPQPTAAD